jgi:hypothetical protein
MLCKTAMAAFLLLAVLPARAQDAAAAAAKPTTYTEDTPVEIIAANPAAVIVLNKDLPGLLDDVRYPLFKSMSLKAMREASDGDLSETDVDKAVSDLQALPPQPDLFPH